LKNFHFSGVWAQITIFGHLGPKIRFGSYLVEKLSSDSGWELVESVIIRCFA